MNEMIKEQSTRDAKFIEIINALNKRKLQGLCATYDCGDLGFAEITWWHGWRVNWITPNAEFKETK